MKLNTIFLIIGLLLSAISKILQFKTKSYVYVGNIVVIPAAVCFCLAVLFNTKKYYSMFFTPETQLSAVVIGGLACGAVIAFQLMMMSFVSGRKTYGMILAVPFLTLVFLFLRNWFIERI